MKLIFHNNIFSAIRSPYPVRPTPLGFGWSVPGLLAVTLLLQGGAVGQGQKVTVTVAPASASLTNSQTQQFTASITGSSSGSGVTWSVSPAVGTISKTGLYTAPAYISGAQTVTVKATTVGGPSKSGTAAISLAPPVGLSVTPSTASLGVSQNQQFTAAVSGTTNTGVTWTVSPAVGTVSSTGFYTAPATLSSSQSVTVTAKSMVNPAASANASVALIPLVSVSVTPSSVSLTASQTQQFIATVSGSSNTPVSWSVSPALGTVSSTGLYTAPASISSAQTVTVKATNAVDATKSASASIALAPTVTVSLTPLTASLTASQTSQFTATVSGSSNTAVTWSVSPAVGTVSSTGLYTAPAPISSAQTVSVKATSVAEPTKSASAAIALAPPVSISVTPSTATVLPSQSQQLIATVTSTSNTGVSWSVNPPVGGFATSGTTAVYTAPSILTSSQNVTITATSMADSAKIASALFTLVQAVAMTMSPTSVTLGPSGTQQFAATVSGNSNTSVKWSITPAVGTINPTGLYTAPATVLTAQTVTVTTQSLADPTQSASAVVSLQPAPHVQFTIDANRLTSLSYGGQSFYSYPDYLVWSANFQAADGTKTNVTNNGWIRPSLASQGSNPLYFQHVYNYGQPRQFTVKVVWTTPDQRTLRADVSVTNNDPTQTLTDITLNFLPFQLPGPALQYNNNIPMQINQYNAGLVGFLSGQWGSVGFFQAPNPMTSSLNASYGDPNQTAFLVNLTSSTQSGPNTYRTPIPPGQTQPFAYLLRFGCPTDTAMTLAPEAFAAFTTAAPYLVNWPDRRPIATWVISEGTDRSPINPRGYLWDPTLDSTNPTIFSQAILSKTDEIIARLKTLPVRPQGVIVWDLEGQEFKHSFTYVGYPSKLPYLSPEMDAVADAVFARLQAAGFQVGMTIRPQDFGTGTTLPATCTTSSSFWVFDKFIKLDAPYSYRGYWCSAPDTWSVSSANEPVAQVGFDDAARVLDLLKRKVSYAKSRWNARLFYVDSNVYSNGVLIDYTIFRALASTFPDCLFIPEGKDSYYFGTTAPYFQANQGIYATPADPKVLYPSAFSVVNVSDSDTTTNWSTLVQGVKSGDILIFRGWWDSPETSAVQAIYAAAGQ